jgi:hypothetical protein
MLNLALLRLAALHLGLTSRARRQRTFLRCRRVGTYRVDVIWCWTSRAGTAVEVVRVVDAHGGKLGL